MSDVYKLQYNGMTLTYPGWNGFLQYQNTAVPFQRYEYTLFESPDGLGVSAGTVSMPFSAFDEVGIGLGWKNYRNICGINYNWFDKAQMSAATANPTLTYVFADNVNYCVEAVTFNYNNNNLTFTTNKNGQALTAMYGGIITPTATTAKFTALNGDTNVITKIIGVKYQ